MNAHARILDLTEEVADLRRQITRLIGLIKEPPAEDRSIVGFCRRKGISKAFFYKLQQQGKGPRVAHAGARRIITLEADWDRERELDGAQAVKLPAALRLRHGREVAGGRGGSSTKTGDTNNGGPRTAGDE